MEPFNDGIPIHAPYTFSHRVPCMSVSHTQSHCPVSKSPAAWGIECEKTSRHEKLLVGPGVSCNEHGEELFPVECEAQCHLLIAVYPFYLGGQVLGSGVHEHCVWAKHHFAGEVVELGPLPGNLVA